MEGRWDRTDRHTVINTVSRNPQTTPKLSDIKDQECAARDGRQEQGAKSGPQYEELRSSSVGHLVKVGCDWLSKSTVIANYADGYALNRWGGKYKYSSVILHSEDLVRVVMLF